MNCWLFLKGTQMQTKCRWARVGLGGGGGGKIKEFKVIV